MLAQPRLSTWFLELQCLLPLSQMGWLQKHKRLQVSRGVPGAAPAPVAAVRLSRPLPCSHPHRYKGLCLKRAKEAGIATARLPIQKHVQLESSSVLAVNHVTQILVEYAQSKDWAAVLNEVLPKRKRADFNAGEGKSKGKGAEAASGGEQAQGENGEKAGAEAEAVQSVQGDGGMVEEQAAGGEGFGDGDVKASGLGQGAQQGAETSTGHNTAGSSQEVQGSGDLEPPAKRLHV